MKAPQQVEMPFSEPSAKQLHLLGRALWEDEILPLLRAAIDRKTIKECAVLFDAQPSYLSDAYVEREDAAGRKKRIAGEWIVQLLIAVPHATRLEILSALCALAGYMAPERKRVLSPEEKLEKYREAVAKRLAAGVLADIEREIEES